MGAKLALKWQRSVPKTGDAQLMEHHGLRKGIHLLLLVLSLVLSVFPGLEIAVITRELSEFVIVELFMFMSSYRQQVAAIAIAQPFRLRTINNVHLLYN